MRNNSRYLFLATIAFLAAACTQNLPHGTQTFTLRTIPEINAKCSFVDREKVVELETPSEITILPKRDDLEINCLKHNYTGKKILESHSNMFNTNLPVPVLETINDIKILVTGDHYYYYDKESSVKSDIIVKMHKKP